MANDNGDKAEGQRKKKCPFLNEYCIEGRCGLWTEMARVQGGLQQKFGMCSYPAIVMLLSEINTKTQPPQQKINIPNLIRG